MEYALYTEYDRRCTSIYRRSLILFKLCSPTVFGCLGTAPHGSLKGTTTGHGTASYIGGFGVLYESPTQAQQHFDDLWLMFAVEASTRYRTKTSTSPADETAKKVQGSPDKLNERERLHRTTPVRNQGRQETYIARALNWCRNGTKHVSNPCTSGYTIPQDKPSHL